MATKTKDIIIDSFLELAEREDVEVEKISITDIVENCQISRQTFYYHFKDINEMLSWAFKNESDKIYKKTADYTKWQDTLMLYKPFFIKYSAFFKKCLNSKMFVYIYSLLYDNLYGFTKDFLTDQIKCKYNNKTDFAVMTYVYALIGFIIRELKKDEPDFDTLITKISDYLSK